MPEYIQNQATALSITNEAFQMISSSKKQEKMQSELLRVQQKLQSVGASNRAAKHILSLLSLNENRT